MPMMARRSSCPRFLVISHAAVIDRNREEYYDLADRLGAAVRLVVPQWWKDGRRLAAEPSRGMVEVVARHTRLTGQIHLYWIPDLDEHVAAFRPDAILVDEEPYSMCAWTVLRSYGRRVPTAFFSKQNIFKRFPWPLRAMERSVLRRSAAAFALTESVAAVLRRKGFTGPIHLLPHGVSVRAFRPYASGPVRDRLGLRGAVVGYVGRLAPEKGIDVLCGALEMLAADSELPPWSALLVGSGPEAPRVRATCHRLGRPAVLLEDVAHADVPRYLTAMDVCAVPSHTTRNWKEQFGRVVVEAMASGVAVVGSDSGHIPHLISETGGGWVFPEGNAGALADALRRAIRCERERAAHAAAARRYVEEHYSSTAVAGRLMEGLSSMMGARS